MSARKIHVTRAQELGRMGKGELARMHAANGGLMGEAAYRKWTKDELVRTILDDERSSRAWDNREHVRKTLHERQPAFAAVLEHAITTNLKGPVIMSATVVFTTNNCEIVLDDYGFYVRCTAPGCTWVSEYTPAKYIARCWAEAHDEDQDGTATIAARLEYLRGEIRAQCISWGEMAELESLAGHIDPGDTELLEWAGIPETEVQP